MILIFVLKLFASNERFYIKQIIQDIINAKCKLFLSFDNSFEKFSILES